MSHLCDVSNKAFDWFLSIVVKNSELGSKVTEYRREHTSHTATDELVQKCSLQIVIHNFKEMTDIPNVH